MDTSGYSGYTNYETYVVCVWLDNDEPFYLAAKDIVAEHADAEDTENDGIATGQTAQALKTWITDDVLPELDGLASELVNAALSEVDWQEVATTRVEE